MLRTLSARSTRMFVRGVRARIRDRSHKSRTAKLRLDTLEHREQPGSVMSGLAAGAAAGMLEPLQIIEAVVGPNALTTVPAGLPVSSGVGGQEPLTTTEPTTETNKSMPATVTGTSESSQSITKTTSGETVLLSAVDPSDLSIDDPAQFNLPTTAPATNGGAGGSGGGSSSSTVSSALAGQSTAQGPTTFVGQTNPGGAGGESLAEPAPAGPTAVPTTTVAVAAGTWTPTSSGGSGRPSEVFVTPPNDKLAPEPPAPTQVRTASILTTSNPLFAVGTDAGVAGQVKVYEALTRNLKYTLSPFANNFTGGVRVAVADVTGDGTSDVVVGQGPGGDNKVRVYNGATGKALNGALGTFAAFTNSQSNGVWVGAGDVTGDGKADVVVGTDGSFAPRAKVFSGANGDLVRTVDPSALGFAGGVRVAAGDLNADGKDEVIVGSAGSGGPARVGAYDGGNGKALYDYLPFGPAYFGGVHLTAGDVSGDGYSDILIGAATGRAEVRVFSGKDTGSTWNLDAFPGVTTGVRVGAVDADGDGKLDVLAGRAPGAGEVRAYAAAGGGQLFALSPFGTTFDKGTFVAGDARPAPPGVTILSTLPEVSITGHTDGTEGGSFTATFARTGATTSSLGFTLSYGGTAGFADYNAPLAYVFNIGESSVTYTFDVSGFYDDTLPEGPETVVLTVQSSPGIYDAGSPATAAVALFDNDAPVAAGPVATAIGPCVDQFGDAPGSVRPSTLPFRPDRDSAGINMASPAYVEDDPALSLAWIRGMVGPSGTVSIPICTPFGTCPVVATVGMAELERAFADLPRVVDHNTMAYVIRCDVAQYFDQSGGNYTARDGAPETFSQNTTNKEFALTDSTGRRFVFHNFDSTIPALQRGLLKSQTDPAGNTVATTTFNGSGQLTAWTRSVTTGGTTTTSNLAYTYLTSGVNSGRVSTITLTEQVGGGSAVTVRTGDLAYYDGATANGTLGDLKSLVVKDSGGAALETNYWRYHLSGSSTGYAGALKYQVTGAAYDRMAAWGAAQTPTPVTVDAMADADVAKFADFYLQYDATQRVTRVDVGAGGCSACSGGIGSYTYSYAVSSFADGYNSWRYRRTETQPDGTVNITYANHVGAPMLLAHEEGGQTWLHYWRYDAAGRLALAAAPSAVSNYDKGAADLLNNQSGNYQYLRDGEGLIGTLSYHATTTATSSTAGGAAGYLYQAGLQRGETGTSVLQGATDYFSRTANSITVYPVASATVYRNTNGTGGQTTSYAWTWNTGSNEPASVTVTLPTVTTAQNGPNTATSATVVADSYGRPVWAKDGGGFLTYLAYDDGTGAVTKVIEDVDTTQTSTFTNLPSGWTTPAGGGLHLAATAEVDDLGRTTKATSPAGDVTYVVYKDSAHEVRVYPGWNSTDNKPTGPTQVYREDRTLGYTEALTMSATPTVNSGRPTGAETIANVQSLRRQVLNAVGQVVSVDEYISLSGTSYSPSTATLGTSGTNYLRTEQVYDKLGLPNKTVTPTGTIYRTFNDGQGRPVSQWVGTDDTPTTGFWSPTNTAGTDLVKVSENQYDFGGVGDGNLTRATEFPSATASENRKTEFGYDWRNRQVATKAGVEASESTSLNRPIGYAEYDNLGQVVASEQYDGDGESITADTNSDGVPDRPLSTALRAKSTAAYDELGRAYQEKAFSVDPTNGSVSTNALTTNHWFDSRGLEIKTAVPGGLVSKAEYDGAGRAKKSYTTDGGGDSGYADADDVTGDAVLSQDEWTYDADGNVTLVVRKERFHDETGTGALGTPSTGVKARVSYQASYYDKADRLTDTVDVGTNLGSAYTRPATPDGRDDAHLVTSYRYNVAGRVDRVTDPRALLSDTHYDLAGRVTKTIENRVDDTVSDADDKTVEYAYNGSSARTTLSAKLTGGGQQLTENVYGVNTSGGLVSNDILKEVRYPDPSSGSSSSTEKDGYTHNHLAEVKTQTDRNGNVHTYTYDVLGRVTAEAITTLGSGVDGTVRRIETAYDGQGNAFRVTSYDAVTGGTVVNEVERAFNGLGQLTREWQATSGAVNTSTTLSVRYAYSEMTGGANHSRLTKITYPNLREVNYLYAAGLSDTISRLSSITDGSTTLESYEVVGLGTVVKRAHPEPGVDLTYIKLTGESDGAAGDKYTGLDAFGRVIDQRWTTSGGTAKDRRQSGYDRDSNRMYADNLVDSTRSELYAYDGLNQLTSFQRGTLNGTKTGLTGAASRAQSWDFDALGNFDSQTSDGTAQTRGHNKQNEITSVSGATTPTFDANGNLTTDETGRTFKYDAWNRLVEVRNSGSTLLATYRYDALGRRVRETRGSTTTDLYYSAAWQVLEERVGSAGRSSYVWSPVYVDALVCRDRDTDGNGTLDERLYAVHDVNFNIVALLNTSGTVVERYAYDPYGGFVVLDGSWGSRSGSGYAWAYQHQGLRWDADLGAYDNRGRVYRPTLARFYQTDPIGFAAGDQNLYRYVGNGPVNGVDPAGLSWFRRNAGDLAMWAYNNAWSVPLGAVAAADQGVCATKKLNSCDVSGAIASNIAFGYGYGQHLLNQGGWALDPTAKAVLIDPVQQRARTLDPDSYDRGITAGPFVDFVIAMASLFIPGAGGAGAVGRAGGACRVSRCGTTRGGVGPVLTGQVGENAVGIVGPKTRINIPGTNRTRIPDHLTGTTLCEVKNVRRLSYIQQLRDFAAFARQNGLEFELWVRSNTQLSGPLQAAIARGEIVLRLIPGS